MIEGIKLSSELNEILTDVSEIKKYAIYTFVAIFALLIGLIFLTLKLHYIGMPVHIMTSKVKF